MYDKYISVWDRFCYDYIIIFLLVVIINGIYIFGLWVNENGLFFIFYLYKKLLNVINKIMNLNINWVL